MRQSAAWLLAAGVVCCVGCQRTVAKTGLPPAAPAAGEVVAAPPGAGAPETGSGAVPAAAGALGASGIDAAQAASETGVAVRPPAAPGTQPPPPAGTPPAGAPGAAPVAPDPDGEPQPKPRVGKEIVIAWEASLMYLIQDGKLVGEPLILNGARRQYLRPQHLGEFKISEKMRLKRSNLYDINGDPLPDKKMAPRSGAVMRNWMRLGKLAVGLHYSPAFRFHRSAGARHRSHGCYRMSRKDSNHVFKWAPVGTPIHVMRYLGGSEWQFLVAETAPDLLPGYRAPRAAFSSPTRKARPRSTSTRTKPRTPARQAASTTPAAAKPAPKPTPQPAAPEKPAPAPSSALDSSSTNQPAPAPSAPSEPAQPAAPAPTAP